MEDISTLNGFEQPFTNDRAHVPLYFLGDTHSVYEVIKRLQAIRARKLITKEEGATIIHIGDFHHWHYSWSDKRHKESFKILEDLLDELNITILVIRGNHDNPSWFSYKNTVYTGRLKFLPSNSFVQLYGLNIFLQGGGISINRTDLIQGVDYWENEGPEELAYIDPSFPINIDIHVAHIANRALKRHLNETVLNSSFKSHLAHYFIKDYELSKDDNKSVEVIQRAWSRLNPKYFICGHYHCSSTLWDGHCMHQVLNINELMGLDSLIDVRNNKLNKVA